VVKGNNFVDFKEWPSFLTQVFAVKGRLYSRNVKPERVFERFFSKNFFFCEKLLFLQRF